MKKRYIGAGIVFAALLVLAIGLGVLNRLYFGAISEAKQNREQPFEISVSMGNTFSLRDVVELIGYTPAWVATSGVEIVTTRSDNTSAEGVLDYDEVSGKFTTSGMGDCILTVRSALDPKVSVQIAFDVKFRSEDTPKLVAEHLKDGYLTKQEIESIKTLEIKDLAAADVQDLAVFTNLETLVLTRSDGYVALKNVASLPAGVSFQVPSDRYEDYLTDESWKALASRVYPRGADGADMVVLHLEGGTLSGASGQDFYAESIGSDGKVHFGDYSVSKTGYTFKGWKIGNEKGELSSRVEKGDYAASGNVKAYAVWDENYYGVAYDVNFPAVSAKNPSPLTPKYTEKIQLATVSATKKGYTFLGWSTSSTAKEATYEPGQTVSGLTAEPGGVVKLYGVWSANTY
ncbi:MAG: InlB B-repeat-containing protein, partial [Clostridia bacterium]|nr:InlB B-repeat-containing protein [Clostridia bacterium]